MFWGLLLCVLAGCRRAIPDRPPPDSPPVSETPRYLALGDSYTIGEGVRPAERWPVQLVRLLKARGIALDEPTIIAKTGWTAAQLAASLERAPLKAPYAFVTLLIGVNNQYQGRDVEEYRAEFAGLLRRAIELAAGKAERVLVVSIPDWGVTPYAEGKDRGRIAAEIDRFNEVNREETKRAGAEYLHITTGSRRAAKEAGLIAEDGLHPSAKMYEEWAEAALPAAQAALQGKTAR